MFKDETLNPWEVVLMYSLDQKDWIKRILKTNLVKRDDFLIIRTKPGNLIENLIKVWNIGALLWHEISHCFQGSTNRILAWVMQHELILIYFQIIIWNSKNFMFLLKSSKLIHRHSGLWIPDKFKRFSRTRHHVKTKWVRRT